MLPKTHAIAGAIFSILLYYIFHLTFFQASLIFLSSFLIDFDHYVWYVIMKKDFNLKKSYDFFNQDPYEKRIMLLHTVEFLLLVFMFSYIWNIFLFVLYGMLFHSILDIIEMGPRDELKYREYSIFHKIFFNS